ncbi:MAG: hypothetical protein D3909_17265 [Candidatus Electrothrix sp. ATG1]|nr:hypothetical protein [Candidatus Electrothrix sp. ATG1]
MSEHDTANRVFYPLGAGVGRQVSYDIGEMPKYGAIGIFGIQGSGTDSYDLDMLPKEGTYGFRGGEIYNLDSSEIIHKGDGASGAHSDISHPEVAHAFWEGVLVENIC